jgi:hypothetical protein
VYLSTPPNLNNLCPEETGGGDPQNKHSGFVMNHSVLLSGGLTELRSNHNYKNLIQEVFDPTLIMSYENRIKSAELLLSNFNQNENDRNKHAQLLIYQKLLSHFAELLEENKLVFGKSSEMGSRLYQLQGNLISNTSLTHEERFKIEMDRVFTHRINGQLDEAQDALGKLLIRYNEQSSFINTWICIIQNEIKLQQGQLDKKTFVKQVEVCQSAYNTPMHVVESGNSNKKRSEISSNNTYSIYPNPAKNEIHLALKLQGKDKVNLKVIDVMGREVINTNDYLLDGIVTIDVSQLPNGVYSIICEQHT